MKVIWEEEGDRRKYCPSCGGKLDAWGLCREAAGKISLDLASAWRLASQSKGKLSQKEIRERIDAIAAQPLTSEHAGSICLICKRQFLHGVCPGCGLPIKYNSRQEIFFLHLFRDWPK
ncbi:MAG: hypothetical protein WC528_04260 [Patescibacteria group bacterium]